MDLFLFNKVAVLIFYAFSLSVTAFLAIRLIKGKLDVKTLRKALFGALALVALFIFLKISFQYFFWKSDAFAKYFLPPYTDIFYFYQYSFFNFLLPILITVAFSGFLLFIFFIIEKVFKKSFLVPADKYLFFIFSLLIGWPNTLVFLSLTLVLAVVYSVFASLATKNAGLTVSLTPFWPIAALVTLVFGDYVAKLLNLHVLTV